MAFRNLMNRTMNVYFGTEEMLADGAWEETFNPVFMQVPCRVHPVKQEVIAYAGVDMLGLSHWVFCRTKHNGFDLDWDETFGMRGSPVHILEIVGCKCRGSKRERELQLIRGEIVSKPMNHWKLWTKEFVGVERTLGS